MGAYASRRSGRGLTVLAVVVACAACSGVWAEARYEVTDVGSMGPGGMVATVLGYMGISRVRVAAIVFVIAGLSAAAPPVSLWAC